MSVNIGNNEAEQFSNYRNGIEDNSDNLPEDISSDEDEDNTEDADTEDEEQDEEEFKEELNTNFPLSGGGSSPVDDL